MEEGTAERSCLGKWTRRLKNSKIIKTRESWNMTIRFWKGSIFVTKNPCETRRGPP